MKYSFGRRVGRKEDVWYELNIHTGIITCHSSSNNHGWGGNTIEGVVDPDSISIDDQLELLRLLIKQPRK